MLADVAIICDGDQMFVNYLNVCEGNDAKNGTGWVGVVRENRGGLRKEPR